MVFLKFFSLPTHSLYHSRRLTDHCVFFLFLAHRLSFQSIKILSPFIISFSHQLPITNLLAHKITPRTSLSHTLSFSLVSSHFLSGFSLFNKHRQKKSNMITQAEQTMSQLSSVLIID